jgi:hypothetical protein
MKPNIFPLPAVQESHEDCIGSVHYCRQQYERKPRHYVDRDRALVQVNIAKIALFF